MDNAGDPSEQTAARQAMEAAQLAKKALIRKSLDGVKRDYGDALRRLGEGAP